MDLPGEQIRSFSKEGKIHIWADLNARDTSEGVKKMVNQKQTGNGYNLFTLGGL